MNRKTTFITGLVFGGLAVGLGAFGAHALEALLTERGRTDTWDLAVQYQIIHALLLLFTGLIMRPDEHRFSLAAGLITAGVICFSGSLYMLCLTDIIFPLVLITPFGGILLIAGWTAILIGVVKTKITQ